jgi:hypothetical protein
MHTVLIFSAEVMKLGSGGLVVGGRKERRLRGKGLSETRNLRRRSGAIWSLQAAYKEEP